MMKKLSLCSTSSRYNDIGLLIIRVVVAGTLCLKHGTEKAFDFHTMATNTKLPFPDPIHIGVVPSLFIAMLSDFVAALLMVFGLGTRWAAGFAFINIMVAYITVHHFSYWGPRADHGEIIVLMLGTFLGLIFTGPGRISLDYLVTKWRDSRSVRVNENAETGLPDHA
jgi:putative oxidoreductase